MKVSVIGAGTFLVCDKWFAKIVFDLRKLVFSLRNVVCENRFWFAKGGRGRQNMQKS